MFDAREWLESVAAASRSIRSENLLSESRRDLLAVKAYDPTRVIVASSPSPDKMVALDALIDWESARDERMMGARREIESALLAFEGMRRVGAHEAEAADVLELVYVGLSSYRYAARQLHVSSRTIRRWHDFGVDWLDAHGIAHAKEGIGHAEQ